MLLKNPSSTCKVLFSGLPVSQLERKKNPILSIINGTLIDLPTPININNFWNFGRMLGAFLGVQIIRGIFLASHYNSSTIIAFDSITHIMRDVNMGWLIRIVHLNGASFFFVFIFLHIFRNLYYRSFFFQETWNIGILILLLRMIVAFMGYVLPWGQIRFWGATVITNFITAIPIVGKFMVEWIWGGFSVGEPTLSRFFMIHFISPFIISAIVLLHIFFLHRTGRHNPTNSNSSGNSISFHWYLTSKDLHFFLMWIIFFEILIFLFPFLLGDPENFILANPIVTPVHIVPEWYFLFAYAILRSIPDKLLGVISLIARILILLIPRMLLNSKKSINKSFFLKKTPFVPLKQYLFFYWISVSVVLTWIGGQVVEDPFIIIGQVFVFIYFFLFVFIFYKF